MKKAIRMRSGNTGLTVKVNLWSLAKYTEDFDAESARLWIKSSALNFLVRSILNYA